ncbi:hemolysin family protein [Nocardioidaceae bacterium]|nr:hemolysin family protein [Nocardioidaceae bacterium]
MTEAIALIAAVLLIVACGIFVAAEFAFVTVDRNAVDRAVDDNVKGADGVQTALRQLSTQLSGAQVGITITNLAIGFLAEPALAGLLSGPLTALGVPDSSVRGIALLVGLVLATFLTMIFGELVPKNIAIAAPLATARATQGPQRLFTAVMARPIRVLNGTANALVRRLGAEPQEELRSARSAGELASLVRRSASEGTLDEDTAGLVQRSVAFGDRTAGEIMTPRVRMASVTVKDSAATVIDLARVTGFSRFPVVTGDADEVVGAIHVKHAVAVPRDRRRATRVRELMVDIATIPESLRLDPLMQLLRTEGFQVAVVVDEYGGTAGIVTLEDVVEEIVGEITDEHDRREIGGRSRRRRDGAWSLSGLLRPDEVEAETGVPLPEDEAYDTVAGLLVRHLGRIPEAGDAVEIALPVLVDEDGDPLPATTAVLTVERMAGLRVDRLTMTTFEAAVSDEDEHASDRERTRG